MDVFDKLDKLRRRRERIFSAVLQYRHDIGKLARAVVEDFCKTPSRRRYGGLTIEALSSKLGDEWMTIHLSLKFARQCNKSELGRLKKNAWSWYAVTLLLSLKGKKRERFKKAYEKNYPRRGNVDEIFNRIRGPLKLKTRKKRKRRPK